MAQKSNEKTKAIRLRKQGKTYNEILEVVPVAKSTLSLWLREVGLSKGQKQRLTAKKHAAQLRGGARKRAIREESTRLIFSECKKDINSLSKRELFLLGVALYWAEGSKQKMHSPSVGIDFANSDPEMIRLFLSWLQEIAQVPESDIKLTIHLHKNHMHRYEEVIKYWLQVTRLPKEIVTKPIIKKHNPQTRRKNTGDDYFGLVSIYVRKSTNLNRRIMGWIYAIIATQK